VTIDPALRYEDISPKAYEHPADRAATAALRSGDCVTSATSGASDRGVQRVADQISGWLRARPGAGSPATGDDAGEDDWGDLGPE
jgi:hypothetical protein